MINSSEGGNSMKRIILSFLFLFVALGVFASSSDIWDFAFNVADTALDVYTKGDRPHKGMLDEHLSSLNVDLMGVEGRRAVFEALEVPSAWPVAKNVLIGFGSGSKSQGDVLGYMIGAAGDGIGVGLLGASLVCFSIDMLTGGYAGINQASPLIEVTKALAISGAVVIGVNRLLGIIPPLVYASSYNSKLRKGLGLDNDLNLIAVPTVSYKGDMGVTMVASIAF